ncbi:aminotransferase class V-fold PLP-dependent enzyme [Maribacter aquivivus]|uniref:aminotransferase class V-fold PLP-dependent enzyme n=1 Tax=Maribacter aquivivus TaxID=228958 RepID=UPI00249211BA|nr:aminotransferase class V-fold PLP-dependent enzyme [Maribacter aquivivus]
MTTANSAKGAKQSSLELHFAKFKSHVVGENAVFETVYGTQNLLYADWIASGRLYGPIEDTMRNKIGPMIANTHSFSSETGKASTYAYRHAREIIKKHVNANKNDVLVTAGTGMTGVLSRLQRIMGLRWPDAVKNNIKLPENERPVVFISHMEHHSNQVPWMETIADVVIVPCDENNLICPKKLRTEVEKYPDRPQKIGAFTACSNVTGIISRYHELAKVMHQNKGICIMDFAASAPYVEIDMHPKDPEAYLDAVLFSPHKFLGGPGTCGVLVFNKNLYNTDCPDVPGGGNVKWTNPWGAYSYHTDIETKEDGGTPGFLQVMRTALVIRLKEKMGTTNIEKREEELLAQCFTTFSQIDGLFVLGENDAKRIGVISFGIKGAHYNLVVRLLNDRFGIQVRGGWSCASTYCHYLFRMDTNTSTTMTKDIENSNLTDKPGWVRLSLHPITSDKELVYICDAVNQVAQNFKEWGEDYVYNPKSNEFDYKNSGDQKIIKEVTDWFTM